MTERLYLQDPYVTEFQADVLERRTTDDGPALVFARTYFYPESGGQPWDLGTIDDIPVTRVVEGEGEIVLHFLERLPEGNRVSCRIDQDRRRDHMQQHSGQHILSAAFLKEAAARTTSFHLGSSVSTIDLDKASLSEDEVRRAESAANEAVRRALPITSRVVEGEGAESLGLRKSPPPVKELRLVEVQGLDRQACCGTHPRTSSEVGPVLVRGFERFKGGTRVEFLCGDRALRDHRTSVSRLRALASILSSSEADLVAAAERLQEERKSLRKELDRLGKELLLLRVEDWMAQAETWGEARLLVKVAELGPSELRAAASELTSKPGRIVLLGSLAEGRAHLIFAASRDVEADMGRLLQECLEPVEGRGGGSARIAQGGGPIASGLPEALERARVRVHQQGQQGRRGPAPNLPS